jgi:hypothetical protein
LPWHSLPDGEGVLDIDNKIQDNVNLGFWPVAKWTATSSCSSHFRQELAEHDYVSCIYQWFEALADRQIVAWRLLEESAYVDRPTEAK